MHLPVPRKIYLQSQLVSFYLPSKYVPLTYTCGLREEEVFGVEAMMQVLEALSNRVLDFGAWIAGLLVGGLFQVQCQIFQKCGWNAMLPSNRHTLSLEDSSYTRFWSRDPLE